MAFLVACTAGVHVGVRTVAGPFGVAFRVVEGRVDRSVEGFPLGGFVGSRSLDSELGILAVLGLELVGT